MLCGVWSNSPERWHPTVRLLAQRAAGPVDLLIDGPLAVAAAGATRASNDVATCLIAGTCQPSEAGPDTGPAERTAQVALSGFARGGASGLAGLPGQFSAMVWEPERTRLSLVCDHLARLGWYVFWTPGGTLFATELRDLLGLSRTRPGPDPVAFSMWLGGHGCPEHRTLYEGVSRLGPGEYFECRDGTVDRRVAWQPRYVGTFAKGRRELAEGLRDELRRATWSHMIPGVNGVILSGGVDSSVVAAVAAECRADGVEVRGYSATFPGEPWDESDKIRAMGDALGIRVRAHQPAPQGAFWLALRYLQQWQLPLVAPGSVIDMSAVTAAAADGAGVVLDGQTGDEVLGFTPFVLADRLAHGRLLAAARLMVRWPSNVDLSPTDRWRLLRIFGLKGLVPYGVGRRMRDRRDRSQHGPRWLLPRHRQTVLETADYWAWKVRGSGPRWWRSMTDTLIWGPHRELRLEYLRHRATSAGLRWGSPLYDEKLIEFCSRLSPELAFDSHITRPLAREALEDRLPDLVRLQTRKANFSPFAARTLRADAHTMLNLIGEADTEIRSFVDLEWIRARWRPGSSAPSPGSPLWGALWRTAVGEAWLRAASDPARLAELSDEGNFSVPVSEPRELGAR